ncbi:MAG: phospholipase D family protein [Gammaproteobacteria bacterium]|nr:phospholipase D family protein [Gammaproteobacteria bacterium]
MLIVQSPTNPGKIRDAIIDLIPERLVSLRVASAYTTGAGSKILLEAVADVVGERAWSAISKILVTSFDFGITEPNALRHWLALDHGTVRVAGADRIASRSVKPSTAFHPKVYAFHLDDQTCNLLVTSANLTARGFTVNTEAGWPQLGVSSSQVAAAFSRLCEGTQPLSVEVLDAYDERRHMQRQASTYLVEGDSVTPFAPSGQLPSFREFVEAGNVDLQSYDAMWVQVEALQGGSSNQIELPRRGHGFFGFSFADYEYPKNFVIGRPRLRMGNRQWVDRPLTWHGNNRMERLNLPTQAQGGPDYSSSVVRFRRLPDDWFELAVTPLDSDLANAWKHASSENGNLFRLAAQASARLVGLL